MDKNLRLKQHLKKIKEFNLTDEQLNDSIEHFLDSQIIYENLKKAGYPDIIDFPHSSAYINSLKPLSDNFINVVFESLPNLKHQNIIVPFLRESKNKFDGSVLIPIFNQANRLIKWSICDAITHNPPFNLNNWVKNTYLDKRYDYGETGLLPLAIVKMFPKDEARSILKKGFDHQYRVTPEAIGKVGKAEDIPFLKEKLLVHYDATHVHKDIEKAIKKIQKREKL